jgi:hypothetical protein
MTNKEVKQALAEVEQKARAFSAATQGETADEILTQMRGEEPASEDLDEEMHRYFKEWMGDPVDVARHFANWQKQQMMKDALTCTVERHYDKRIGKYLTPDIVLNEPAYEEGDKVKLIIVKESI